MIVKTNGPSFLQGVNFTPQVEERLRPHMENWLKAYAYAKTLEPTLDGIQELRCMMMYELLRKEGTRLHMVNRLRGRFISLRNQYEEAELYHIIGVVS